MGEWYQHHIVDTGRSAAAFAMLAFLLTYAITRWTTRRIRIRQEEEKGTTDEAVIKDVYIGGVHIHHQVWGILLVLAVGLVEFRYRPTSPWQEILGALFGIGAALALDEFALWLHLQDVYWTDEGRKSIDAVIVACVIGMGLLIGTSPLGLDDDESAGLAYVFTTVLFQLALTLVCLLKGKLATGLIGVAVPVVSLVGAIRLAKPTSFWARRFYNEKKERRAHKRFGTQYEDRWNRVRDVIGGEN